MGFHGYALGMDLYRHSPRCAYELCQTLMYRLVVDCKESALLKLTWLNYLKKYTFGPGLRVDHIEILLLSSVFEVLSS